MCEILTVSEKAALGVRNITKHIGSGYTSMQKCVVFLKYLHNWQEFYTTAGRNGRDKFQV